MSTSVINHLAQLFGTNFQLPDRTKLYLPDSLRGNAILYADVFKGIGLPVVLEVIALRHDVALAFLQFAQNIHHALMRILLHEDILGIVGRIRKKILE